MAENIRIADALDGLLWPNMAIGNKAVIQSAIEALRAYHAQPAPVVPEGYKLVPTELTSEMVKAFRSFCEAYDDDFIAGYKAMLAAAPKEVK